MQEVILSLVPTGSTPLSDILSVDTVNDTVVYFQGILPMFSHPLNDKHMVKVYAGLLLLEIDLEYQIPRFGVLSINIRQKVQQVFMRKTPNAEKA